MYFKIFLVWYLFFALSITYPYIWMRSAMLFKLTENIEWNSSVWKVWGILTNRSKTKFFLQYLWEKKKIIVFPFYKNIILRILNFFWPSYVSSSYTVYFFNPACVYRTLVISYLEYNNIFLPSVLVFSCYSLLTISYTFDQIIILT